jgi:hypothetical protein
LKIYKENKLKVKRIVKIAANPRKYTDAYKKTYVAKMIDDLL